MKGREREQENIEPIVLLLKSPFECCAPRLQEKSICNYSYPINWRTFSSLSFSFLLIDSRLCFQSLNIDILFYIPDDDDDDLKFKKEKHGNYTCGAIKRERETNNNIFIHYYYFY